jgi:SAM-dependent methyltransferase
MFAINPLSDPKIRILNSLAGFAGKRALDIGFGMGQNLLHMKRLGAEVEGVDLDSDAVAFVRTTLGISNVRHCSVEDLPETPRYDLITMHDIIEHPLDPLGLFRKVHSLLEPRGLLSVWTPNASSASRNQDPLLFRVDLEHMQYLTFHTCQHIADLLNMTIVHLGAYGLPRLETIRAMSAAPPRRTAKHRLRGLVKSLPGFVQLNAWRKDLGSRHALSGDYHLMCVMRRSR